LQETFVKQRHNDLITGVFMVIWQFETHIFLVKMTGRKEHSTLSLTDAYLSTALSAEADRAVRWYA
jgi:hypothetical protein